ncbi:MAG TPA: tetratricopeptide repeat protein [Pyrinomonadaceae bacterium]|jgi:tetratricopeptide (TPR) repeat protein|nr:tetratricopeptide repeat protein [Pyrinomonadaceae bacterium]
MAKMKSLQLVVFLACATCLLALPTVAQTGSDSVDAAFSRATQLHQAGDIEGAIRGYESILTTHPERVDVRSNLGAAYSRLGRYEDAIAQYTQALKLDNRNESIRFNLALAYYKGAMFVEAADEFTKFLASAAADVPQRPNAVMLLADCQVRLGNYKKVIESLSPLAEAEPNNRAVAFLLGSALISDGQLNRGQLLIDKVFHDEDSAEAHLLLGSTLLLADDGHGAIKEFERGIQLDPNLPTLQAWYGRALMRMGDAARAKTAFHAELSKNQNDFDANLFMGVLLRQDKEFDDALQYLSRAVRLRPRDQYARYHMAALYAALARPKDALPLLEGVAKEYPEFSEARVLLASVYYRLNRKEDGDREKAAVQKLTAEQQAKQPGAQNEGNRPAPVKPPNNFKDQFKERR